MHTRHLSLRARWSRGASAIALFGLHACASQRFERWNRGASHARPSAQTLGIVRVRIPWYAPSFVVRSRFRDAVAEYEALSALDAKYFTLTDDGRFGGIYLWNSRDDARAFYTDRWRSDIRARRGSEPELVLYDVSAVIEGSARPIGESLGARSIAFSAHATLWLWPRASAVTADALAAPPLDPPGLIRSFVVRDATSVGLLGLWANRAASERALAGEAAPRWGAPATHTRFEAPVLLDAAVRARR